MNLSYAAIGRSSMKDLLNYAGDMPLEGCVQEAQTLAATAVDEEKTSKIDGAVSIRRPSGLERLQLQHRLPKTSFPEVSLQSDSGLSIRYRHSHAIDHLLRPRPREVAT